MSKLAPIYMNLNQTQELLKLHGIELSKRQMQRAAEKDGSGRRKLPFFVDPIDGKLKIEKNTLLSIYQQKQLLAEREAKLQ